jgi:hypothetical protein
MRGVHSSTSESAETSSSRAIESILVRESAFMMKDRWGKNETTIRIRGERPDYVEEPGVWLPRKSGQTRPKHQ